MLTVLFKVQLAVSKINAQSTPKSHLTKLVISKKILYVEPISNGSVPFVPAFHKILRHHLIVPPDCVNLNTIKLKGKGENKKLS